jgi:hypothetical protein
MRPAPDHRGASFVLIPGAGGMAWYWHQVSSLLQHAGHEAVAVELPGDDENVGLHDYAEIVGRAIGERSNVILVACRRGVICAVSILQKRQAPNLAGAGLLAPLFFRPLLRRPGSGRKRPERDRPGEVRMSGL